MAEAPDRQGDTGEHGRICWQCGNTYPAHLEECPEDGAQLVQLDPTETKDRLLGRVFDYRFRIIGKLGEGGMSRVYAAQRLEGEGRVALKVLKADFLRDPEVRKRFMYEARVISNLEHPTAVDLFDFGQAPDGSFYMVMELLEGESLADRLDGGALTYREIFAYLPPICGVLAEAHLQDVIHRDLKPENIFLADLGEPLLVPKLLDFGIAKHLRSRTMTKNDQLWGTPAYMSPEQANGEQVAGTADIYAMGVMLYELIAGVLPFRATTAMGFATKHMHREPTPLTALPGIEDVPERLERFVLKLLSKDPAQRPADMGEVVKELRTIEHAVFDDQLLDSYPSLQLNRQELEEPEEQEVQAPGHSGNIEIDPSLQRAQTEMIDSETTESSSGRVETQPITADTDVADASQTQPTDLWEDGDGDWTPWMRRPIGMAVSAGALLVFATSAYLVLGSGEADSKKPPQSAEKTPKVDTGPPPDRRDDSARADYVSKAAGIAASVRIRARGILLDVSNKETEESDEEHELFESEPEQPSAPPEPNSEPLWDTPSEEIEEAPEADESAEPPVGTSPGPSGGRQKEESPEDNVSEALESTF